MGTQHTTVHETIEIMFIVIILLIIPLPFILSISTDPCCFFASDECSKWCAEKDCQETCTYYCGIFNTDCGSWVCEEVAGFSCRRTTTTVRTTTTEMCQSTVPCSNNAASGAELNMEINSRCYALYSASVTGAGWNSKEQFCDTQLNGSLAAVTSQCVQTELEDKLLRGPVTANLTSKVYIGGRGAAPDLSDWFWASRPTDSWDYTHPDQPTDASNSANSCL